MEREWREKVEERREEERRERRKWRKDQGVRIISLNKQTKTQSQMPLNLTDAHYKTTHTCFTTVFGYITLGSL